MSSCSACKQNLVEPKLYRKSLLFFANSLHQHNSTNIHRKQFSAANVNQNLVVMKDRYWGVMLGLSCSKN